MSFPLSRSPSSCFSLKEPIFMRQPSLALRSWGPASPNAKFPLQKGPTCFAFALSSTAAGRARDANRRRGEKKAIGSPPTGEDWPHNEVLHFLHTRARILHRVSKTWFFKPRVQLAGLPKIVALACGSRWMCVCVHAWLLLHGAAVAATAEMVDISFARSVQG